jgi:hypothetical protein
MASPAVQDPQKLQQIEDIKQLAAEEGLELSDDDAALYLGMSDTELRKLFRELARLQRLIGS